MSGHADASGGAEAVPTSPSPPHEAARGVSDSPPPPASAPASDGGLGETRPFTPRRSSYTGADGIKAKELNDSTVGGTGLIKVVDGLTFSSAFDSGNMKGERHGRGGGGGGGGGSGGGSGSRSQVESTCPGPELDCRICFLPWLV